MDDMMMPNNGSMMMHMATSFFFGLQRPLLFSTWNLNNPGELVGAIIVVVIFAILYELLKTVRELLMYFDLKRIHKSLEKRRRLYRSDSKEGLIMNDKTPPYGGDSLWKELRQSLFKQYINPTHLLQSALHVVQVGMGYLLMLVAMTFNGWLFLAVCFGAGLGYLIFGRIRQAFGSASLTSREQYEHCH